MHKSFPLWVLVFFQPLLAQSNTSTPIVLPPGSPQPHLVNKTPPIYPLIARAAHIAGSVSLRIEIGPDGHIVSAKVLDGQEMLRSSARDSVRQWLYSPVLVDGKPVSASTTVTIPFDLKAPASRYAQPSAADAMEGKLRERFHWLEEACTQALASKGSDPSKQVEQCQKVADLADQFSANGFFERSRGFTYLSTAFRNNKHPLDALTAANRAVAAVQQGFLCCAQASSAYSVRAEAEAKLGKLAEASEDLTIAEDEERSTITEALSPASKGDFAKANQTLAARD